MEPFHLHPVMQRLVAHKVPNPGIGPDPSVAADAAGRAGTMTHDYERNGTTTLFAALDVLTGTVIGQCLSRHRHEEFITFLNTIDRQVPAGLQVHLILDNYATHKHPNVQKWRKRHKRFHFHFTPTSSSWLNQVERWFRELTDKNLRRGIFPSVPDLIAVSSHT